MKKSGISMTALLHALVVIAMFAITISSVHAHAPDMTNENSAHSNSFDTHPHELDCDFVVGRSHRLHCHLTSTGAEATGPTRTLNDDQPEMFVLAAIPTARNTAILSALTASHTLITGPPSFILFGNFRS